ncbi:hypothetical protein [Streptomyces althioticus]
MEIAIALSPPIADTTPAAAAYKSVRCDESIHESQSPDPVARIVKM